MKLSGNCSRIDCRWCFPSCISCLFIIRIGWYVEAWALNEWCQAVKTLSLTELGHDPDRMCHSTGVDVAPNVTAHRAMPYTCIGLLLYGLILVFTGIILSNNCHAFACLVPHWLTLAITVPRLLLMITSPRLWNLFETSFGWGSLLDFLVRKMLMLYYDACDSLLPLPPLSFSISFCLTALRLFAGHSARCFAIEDTIWLPQ